MKFIVTVSFIIGVSLRFLPFEYVDGNPIPAFIFKRHPSLFHAFVICIMFAFTGSFSALMIGNKFRSFGKISEYYSSISMVLASLILVYTLALDHMYDFSP